jgi:IMP dehydrogenase/GMP reductase
MANLISKENKFDFDDITLVPKVISSILSRSECNIKTNFKPFNKEFLPLMTAPMDTVINETNYQYFYDNDIIPILPRKKELPLQDDLSRTIFNDDYSNVIVSLSLEQFNHLFTNDKFTSTEYLSKGINKILIDTANGHMQKIIHDTKFAKERYGDDLWIMVGNIANPDTFPRFKHVDAIRCGIGGGHACTTSANVAIHYPMGSLISEIYDRLYSAYHPDKIKIYGNDIKIPLIIADGGFRNYSDIIKALALGADYVMLGSIFNKALESCSSIQKEDGTIVSLQDAYELLEVDIPLYKNYRGMSTKAVQRDWGKEVLRTSEGIEKLNQVEYTLVSWVDNFQDYLKSAMSYSDAKTLKEFKEKSQYVKITDNALKRFKK